MGKIVIYAVTAACLFMGNAQAALQNVGNDLVYDTTLNITWMKDANMVKTSCDANDTLWRAFNLASLWPDEWSGRDKDDICAQDGRLNWHEALIWIFVLNSQNYLGYNDWRQPATHPVASMVYDYHNAYNGSTDIGFNISGPDSVCPGCLGSDLAHLHYNSLGNGSWVDVTGTDQHAKVCPPPNDCVQNTQPFHNLKSASYWSDSDYVPDFTYGWYFNTDIGYQGVDVKANDEDGYFVEDGFYVWPVRIGQSAVAAFQDLGNGLEDVGNGLVNDTRLNITWMKDANMVKTSCDANDDLWRAFDPASLPSDERSSRDKVDICSQQGLLNWYEAEAWMAVLNAQHYRGHNDWRLPATNPVDGKAYNYNMVYKGADGSTDVGYNISGPDSVYPGSTGSELAHLHYSLGNGSWYDAKGADQNEAVCPSPNYCVQNTGPFDNLQSSAYWSGTEYQDDHMFAWFFDTHHGYQSLDLKLNTLVVWPVRSGQEAVAAVSKPIPTVIVNGE